MNEKAEDQTNPIEPGTQEEPKKKFFERRFSWYLLGTLLVVLIVLIGGITGIPRGINQRVRLAETQAAPKIQSQLENARLDIEEGRFEVALDRLDWILEEMSPYLSNEELVEVGELYSQTLLRISTYRTPTPMPSPTPTVPINTPTPDLRGEEEMFATAQQFIADEAWDEAIQTLEALREKNIEFRTVQVDGLLYVALRNRGMKKILVEGNLEPGLYDLALAERFAPLDSTAEGVRTWTRMYLTGASYWGVDWAQVIYYLEQVYPQLPSLRDSTYMTTKERYRIALIEYGTQLAKDGDACGALEYFERALELVDDPQLQPTATWAANECAEGGEEEEQEDEDSDRGIPPTTAPTQANPTTVPTQAPTITPTIETTTTQETTPEPTAGTPAPTEETVP